MANLTSRQLSKLGLWPKGIDNRRQEDELSTKHLRVAQNIDLSRTGMPIRRNGVTLVKSGVSMNSGFATPAFPWALAVEGGALKAYDTAFNATTLLSGIDPLYPISYAEINGEIYWSNRLQSGKITQECVNVPWGVPNPGGQPILTPLPNVGGLQAGGYQVAVTFMLANGEEGGSTQAALVEVPEGGGITVSSIPQPTDPRVVAIRVYMCEWNDEVPYWVRDVAVGITSVTLGVAQHGKMLETQFCFPTPAGQIVRYGNARMWSAQDNVVWYSEPQYYGQCRLAQNYIVFNERIDVMEYPNEGEGSGLFVVAGKRTYFIAGQNPKDAQLRIVHPFGGVPGTGASVPGVWFDSELGGNVAFWMDSNGVPVLGLANGIIRPLTQEAYMGPIADSGAVLVRETNGNKQVITNLRGTSRNTAAASDDVVAVVTRNGLST